MIQSTFLLDNITNRQDKMKKLTFNIGICFVSSNLYETHETVHKIYKIPFGFQQDARTYAGNLIYDVRLLVNVGDRLAKNSAT